MTGAKREHWDEVYRTKAADSVSWYQPTPGPSLRALDELQLPVTASLIDVGGGASNLVDRLIERGWSDLTVLDIAAPALEVAKARLRDEAGRIAWVVADVTSWQPDRHYDVWHDRAVFHFLTTEQERAAYVAVLLRALKLGGDLIVATFAEDGPSKCSGLPITRYTPSALQAEFGSAFTLLKYEREEHYTPFGTVQRFVYGHFRRAAS